MQLVQSQATAAQRRIPVYLVDDTDGKTPETGITFSAGEIKISKNGGAEANHAGTVTELASGMYYYEATAAELDTLGFLSVRLTKSGVRTFAALVQVIPALTAVSDSSGVTTLLGRLTALRASGLDNLDAPLSSNFVGIANYLENAAVFMDENILPIRDKTDNLPANPAAVGSAMTLAADSVNASALAADAVSEIQSGLATASALTTLSGYVDTEVSAIKAKTDNLPADPADASDIAASFVTVNGKLDTIDDFLDTEVSAIKAKTDNLPADPADASDIAASFSTVNATLATLATQASVDTIDDFLDTEIAAIKAKTDNLPSDPADESSIQAALSTLATQASVNTIDDFLDTEVAAIKAKTDLIPAAPAAVGDIPTSSAIATAVWSFVVEGALTAKDFMRLIYAGVLNKLSGANTNTVRIRDLADSKDRVVATVDEHGNRTAVTVDPS